MHAARLAMHMCCTLQSPEIMLCPVLFPVETALATALLLEELGGAVPFVTPACRQLRVRRIARVQHNTCLLEGRYSRKHTHHTNVHITCLQTLMSARRAGNATCEAAFEMASALPDPLLLAWDTADDSVLGGAPVCCACVAPQDQMSLRQRSRSACSFQRRAVWLGSLAQVARYTWVEYVLYSQLEHVNPAGSKCAEHDENSRVTSCSSHHGAECTYHIGIAAVVHERRPAAEATLTGLAKPCSRPGAEVPVEASSRMCTWSRICCSRLAASGAALSAARPLAAVGASPLCRASATAAACSSIETTSTDKEVTCESALSQAAVKETCANAPLGEGTKPAYVTYGFLELSLTRAVSVAGLELQTMLSQRHRLPSLCRQPLHHLRRQRR